ncbi:MAG: hypothetical protein OHK0046_02200 [Anaerolineae bacterium]
MDETGLILVVDDNEMNRDVLVRRLQRQKFEVEVAEDGEQALAMLAKTPYDLVLLDVQMPKLNGYEVLERIKTDPLRRDVPVIMITAVDDLDSVVKCIELGADDYMFKPFNPVLLKARVNASLERSRRFQQGRTALLPELQPVLEALMADAQHLSRLEGEHHAAAQRLLQNAHKLAELFNL